jgi:hypothetical protein
MKQSSNSRYRHIVVVIVTIAMCALPLEVAGWTGFLAFRRGTTAPSGYVRNKPADKATGHNSPSPIRAMFSLAE